ncbi:MAG: hypothetical protein IJ644_11515 [Oscillospiraceae bacterium]|nr:hypothetical protein [Oscillospiraceae bacterium]
MIKFPEIDNKKRSALMQMIEEINRADNPEEYEQQLQNLTGKPEISFREVLAFWEWTNPEDFARSLLMPEPEKQNLSDSELSDIITAVWECRYSEPETDYLLKVLETETGRTDVSDLIFYPETDEISAIIGEILRKA